MKFEKKCSACEKWLDVHDLEGNFSFDKCIGFGSKFADKHIQFDLCSSCFDRVMQQVLSMIKNAKIENYVEEITQKHISDDRKVNEKISNYINCQNKKTTQEKIISRSFNKESSKEEINNLVCGKRIGKTMIQRVLNIGYPRACALMQELLQCQYVELKGDNNYCVKNAEKLKIKLLECLEE